MQKIIRIIITLAVIVAAVMSGRWVWDHYLYSPWTRDGKVQADIITIAPDVSGWVTKLAVQDNQQVKKGDVIFQVDVKRYQAVVDELQAQVRNETLALELARHEFSRREKLRQSNSISAEELESSRISADMAEASLDLAKANLASAQIDLERASITSPVDGTIVNLTLREGNYVSQGSPVLSVVAANSIYVTGYFEETKLPLIHEGQKATITLMSGGKPITGTVKSIGNAIADTNTSANGQLLPQVQQTFNWVRLAQRVPVDIELKEIPKDTRLVAGMTASIRLASDGE
ncbi:efflux RND transporter periplasmic adaptor subunit [Alteromonas confluentis]|uniref:Efflux transporter periplasmic adaptor subunit n=1 Tax=Alteromonas confluentis TaxID=1656094 RepID=A0A1E7ZA00_9ALTE|nr:HlyD family secretion protein [Alteromonas confluentis]OFC70307.1 efflux transporter periplasmic adaptor subunit [Alteromonas confluentis]